MKKLAILLTITYLMVAGCSSKNELTREEAFRLIQQDKNYPKAIDYDLYCGDPKYARKAIDAGLDTQGLVTVQRTQKLGEVGNPLIHFTDKAKPYLLPTPSNDQSSNIQKVKVAEEDLVEVTGINTGTSGKDAVVEYTTAYRDLTPFSVLMATNFKQQATRKANFALYDDGWKLEK
jgi:hypothetical protein